MLQLIEDFYVALAAAVPTIPADSVGVGANTSSALPAVNYTVRGGIRDSFYSGSFGLRRTTFQIDIYTKTYAENVTLRDNVLTAFHGFTGVMGSSFVSSALATNMVDTYEDKGERLYRTILEIQITD